MDDVITNLKQIKRIARRQRDRNYDFRAYVKGWLDWSNEKLDAEVHEILASVKAQIDCTQCANCCIQMGPSLDDEDIQRLARRLGMSADVFESVYLSKSKWGEQCISTRPCPFLDGKSCTVHEDRPKDCREFPHLHKEDIRSRSIAFIENAEICPIVFNTLQRLKQRLGWRG